jgi:hypothetical protein
MSGELKEIASEPPGFSRGVVQIGGLLFQSCRPRRRANPADGLLVVEVGDKAARFQGFELAADFQREASSAAQAPPCAVQPAGDVASFPAAAFSGGQEDFTFCFG